MNPVPDLRAYLRSLDAETLAELLHAEAQRDSRLRRELAQRAAAASKVGPALDMLQRLLESGTQADLTPLARRMVDGLDGATAAERRRAVALYARACAAHPPAPDQLADWILATTFHRPDWPRIELADFTTALGSTGLTRIRSTVDALLAGRPGPRRDIARRLAEQVAEVTGDVDTLLTILATKPPTPEVNLRIIRVLRSAGRHGEAIAHAARTMVHRERPRGGALALRCAEFRRNPGPTSYSALREAAAERWPEVRATVLAVEGPAEAIPAYRLYVEELIEQKDPSCYREAARALKELRALHRRVDTAEEFTSYLAELLETHKRKTRLLVEVRNARIAIPKAVTHRKAATMSA
ncbi:hypothetical protein LWP59_00700 [Amycolatopsis acidiphila]|uniref:Uncharacterized protein n=1 Tax=Amycolatopsis acidiphila TaxID=715473 RepID=A0A558AMM1_9PSEU|nr:hypothetical protein [Amycolatopsis acidiphila]TVT25512.1 hypothetical protein FNH06_01470 [Amycolatopsis acidiphila]UIJ60254.1 hypothetical protein LWP59_00700 [Amycolatopsis acidiphila]GHG60483.1 hypothetical protein GCM10017788_14250 [Amycolatopsis acidiphila]